MICRCFLKDFICILIQPVRLQFVRHGPPTKGEEKVWQKECRITFNNGQQGNDERNGEHDKLWATDNVDMKVYKDQTVSSTTTLNSHSKGDHQITSLVASPPQNSHHTLSAVVNKIGHSNNNNNCDDSTNTNSFMSNGNDKLITWTWTKSIRILSSIAKEYFCGSYKFFA